MRTIQSEFEDYKNRASLPVGAIVLFPKLPVPADFLPCDGRKFDKDLMSDLYAYLGTDTTPDYTKKYVKMISDELSPLQTVAWMIPEHTHNFSGSGNTSPVTLNKRINTSSAGNHHHSITTNGDSNTSNGSISASRGSSASYTRYTGDSGVHYHYMDVNFGNHTHSFSVSGVSAGIKEAISKGDSLEVDHVGGVYAIKCIGRIDDAQQIAAKDVIAKVNDLSNKVVNPNLFDNADFTVSQRGNLRQMFHTCILPTVGSYVALRIQAEHRNIRFKPTLANHTAIICTLSITMPPHIVTSFNAWNLKHQANYMAI
ncbi:phage tail fibers [Photobacterium aphoticum]|uniref:Phage tail fibers n=1 Tax=Photobacterium aphoticum TaxID=754436 RepID=A0A090R0D4_9GAMM|nr:phage tail fibers [Photobacterium aphoticum]